MKTRWIFLLPLAGALSACSDGVGPEPGSFRIDAPASELREGGTVALVVRSGDGSIDPGGIEWTSRDRTTLTVDGGRVRGVAPGRAWVVARRGSAVDSVQLTVRFASTSAGVGVRIAGATGSTLHLGGLSIIHSRLDGPAHSTVFQAANVASGGRLAETWEADTLIVFGISGAPSEGSHVLPKPDVVSSPHFDVRGYGTHLRVRESAYRFKAYVPVGDATLDISSLRAPAQPGLATGNVVGSIAFEAAGFQVQIAPDGSQTVTPIGDRTVPVYAEFALPIHHVLFAPQPMDLVGGPYAGRIFVEPLASFVAAGTPGRYGEVAAFDGLAISWRSVGGLGNPDDLLFSARTWIPQPKVGTFEMDGVLPAGDSIAGPWAATSLHARGLLNAGTSNAAWGEEERAICVDGTVTITEYRAATRRAYGLVAGQMACTALWPRNGANTGILSARFRVPIKPLDGLPY